MNRPYSREQGAGRRAQDAREGVMHHVIWWWVGVLLAVVTPVRWQTPFACQDEYWQPGRDHRRSVD